MNSKTQEKLSFVIEKALEDKRIQHFDENSSKQLLLQELSIYFRELEFQNDELRTTQYNLEQTRDELSELIENAPVGYVIYTDDYKIVSTNKYFEQLINIPKNHLKDTSLRNYIHSTTQDDFYLHFGKLKKTGKSDSIELILHSNITEKKVKIESTFQNKNDTVLYMTAFTDITTQKETQAALVESQLNLQNIVSNSPIHIWKFDGSVFNYVNSAMQTFLGINSVTRIDFSLWKYSIHPNDVESFMEMWNVALLNRVPYDFEVRLKNKAGNYRHFWCHVVPVLNELNKFDYFQGYNVDISDRIAVENELRESEEKYRIIAENTSDGILIIDNKFITTFTSPIFDKFLRNNDSNSVNKKQNYFQLMHISDREAIKSEFNNAISITKDKLIYNYKIFCDNNEFCWKEDHAQLIYDAEGKFTHAFIVSRDITERKRNEAKILEYQKELKSYAGHLQAINEEERANLAREIHDEMSQILIALKIEVGVLKQDVLKNNELASMQKTIDAFAKISVLVNNTLKTTLRIISGLRPDAIEILGFIDTTKAYLNDLGERNNIKTSFSTSIEKIDIKSHVELSLFRILQEALINIVRHSKANKISVEINHDNQNVIMTVLDNGVGFNPENNKKCNTYGLIGMRERVSVLKGELKIESGVGTGTFITVKIPLNE